MLNYTETGNKDIGENLYKIPRKVPDCKRQRWWINMSIYWTKWQKIRYSRKYHSKYSFLSLSLFGLVFANQQLLLKRKLIFLLMNQDSMISTWIWLFQVFVLWSWEQTIFEKNQFGNLSFSCWKNSCCFGAPILLSFWPEKGWFFFLFLRFSWLDGTTNREVMVESELSFAFHHSKLEFNLFVLQKYVYLLFSFCLEGVFYCCCCFCFNGAVLHLKK